MTPSIQQLRHTFMNRTPPDSGDRGAALLSVILFMIMLSGMSLVLLGIILGQIGPGYVAQKGTQTGYAAQGGLQSGLAAIRAATKVVTGGIIVGDTSKLPCDVKAQLNGTADSAAYRVKINYYLDDPTGRSESWLNSLSNKMSCNSGSGVSTQPNFAYLVSSGLDGSAAGRDANEGNRSVAAIYKFKVTNVNIAGGRIYEFNKPHCFKADGTSAGSEISFTNPCGSDDPRELWIYDTDWRIKLASSIVTPGDAGLCITSEDDDDDAEAELQVCSSSNTRQLWNWMGDSSWHGRNAANNANSRCLKRQGNDLEVSSTCTQLSPEPAVGAGAASYSTHQVVNYQEFGRCLDVTDVDIAKTFMISYPCKQDPSGANAFDWNHKWFYSEPDIAGGATALGGQQIRVYRNNLNNAANAYCLRTPSGASKYPVFALCSSGGAAINWTRVYNTGTYATSYLFVDKDGRCLAADKNDKYNGNWSRITVESCNGSELQKWNAPASYNAAEFGGFKELAEYKNLGP